MAGYLRSLLLILALAGAGLVSACSGPMPLYSTAAVDPATYSFSYSRPVSRSDQVIYRELRLRLPQEPGAANALTVAVTSSTYPRGLAVKTIGAPHVPYSMVAVADVTVTRADGSVVFSGQRTASASFEYTNQVLTDKQAEIDAAERASVALAETVRLSILTAIARS